MNRPIEFVPLPDYFATDCYIEPAGGACMRLVYCAPRGHRLRTAVAVVLPIEDLKRVIPQARRAFVGHGVLPVSDLGLGARASSD